MLVELHLEPILPQPDSEDQPLIIAGPCAAETEKQVMNTAIKLAAMNIPIFRAGIWKPRTRPNSFEGVGSAGLVWLKRVRKRPVCLQLPRLLMLSMFTRP